MMRVNRYQGICATCGTRVRANAGVLENVDGAWIVHHLACRDADAPQVFSVYSPATGSYITRNRNGLCEDAPCCGCCTF